MMLFSTINSQSLDFTVNGSCLIGYIVYKNKLFGIPLTGSKKAPCN